ncbi:MAG: alginate export family protein [Verrucomicrobiae bacterium]|nr:alginate export family protein [Verrucomicrobiae bacterium]
MKFALQPVRFVVVAVAVAVAQAGETNVLARLKHPVRWLSWGMDWRWRDEFHYNARTLGGYVPGYSDNEYHFQRYRTRVWATVSPVPQLDFDGGLTWEFRTYLQPRDEPFFTPNEIFADRMAVRVGDIGPAQLTVGRQSFSFGNRWLIWDGTPRDGSRTECFDAARLTCELPECATTVDVIYLDLRADAESRLPPINPYEDFRCLTEQNERGVIVYVQNRCLPRARFDGYFIYRHQSPVPRTAETDFTSDAGDCFLFGGRADGRFGEPWRYRTEFAVELGHKNGSPLAAFGVNSQLAYYVADAWNHNFRVFHEYLSGDDPDTTTDEGWDPMWGRRAAWSALMQQTYRVECGDRLAYWTNLHRVGVGWGCNPTQRLELALDYMALFADHNPLRGQPGYTSNGRFRGSLFVGIVRFVFNEHLSGHLRGECFLPGDYYASDRRHAACYLRAEFVLKL